MKAIKQSISQKEILTLKSGYYEYSAPNCRTVEVRFHLPKEIIDMLDLDTLPGEEFTPDHVVLSCIMACVMLNGFGIRDWKNLIKFLAHGE